MVNPIIYLDEVTRPLVIVLIVLFSFAALVATVVFSIRHGIRYRHARRDYVILNSEALRKLREINKKYSFRPILYTNFEHDYDNEHYYGTVSPKDYLIYNLQTYQISINECMKNAEYNSRIFVSYQDEIKKNCVLGRIKETSKYDYVILLKIERSLFEKEIRTPVRNFNITVTLRLTDLHHSQYFDSKSCVFSPKEILALEARLNNKRGNYFMDQEIWLAICRVERAKVSNELRFAIYDRDGHCCRRCGKTDFFNRDLEIDHIIPISKGGKTEPSNLQTLCRSCNKIKGSKSTRY